MKQVNLYDLNIKSYYFNEYISNFLINILNLIGIVTLKSDNSPFSGIAVAPNGNKYYFLNGLFHRKDGPARIITYYNGFHELCREDYFLNDKMINVSNYLDFKKYQLKIFE